MSGQDRAEILARFPRERTWLLPALQAIQHEERWLSADAIAAAADHLRVPRSEAYGVATHYAEAYATGEGAILVVQDGAPPPELFVRRERPKVLA